MVNLRQALAVKDLHRLAKRRLPTFPFEFIMSGVEDEHSLVRNEASIAQHRLLPRYLESVMHSHEVGGLLEHVSGEGDDMKGCKDCGVTLVVFTSLR